MGYKQIGANLSFADLAITKSLEHNRSLKMTALLAVLGIFLVSSCSEGGSPAEKALRLVKKSHALGGAYTVEQTIEDWLRQNPDDVKPIGWETEKGPSGAYLVKYRYEMYSFEKGSGGGIYCFEVDINDAGVRDVTDRFKSKTDRLMPAFENADQTREGVVQDLMREQDLLSGKQRDVVAD